MMIRSLAIECKRIRREVLCVALHAASRQPPAARRLLAMIDQLNGGR